MRSIASVAFIALFLLAASYSSPVCQQQDKKAASQKDQSALASKKLLNSEADQTALNTLSY